MKTKEIFCADEQVKTTHTLEVDANGEIIATCPCGRFIKFPAELTAGELEKLITTHEKDNKLSEAALKVEKKRKASEEVLNKIADK
jgi:hypothetical protein